MNTSIKHTSLIITLFSAIVILGVGCGGRADEQDTSNHSTETTSTASGALSLTAKDPEKGLLSGTFEYNGYTIRFDVARGEEMEKFYQSEGNPTHQIDARLCDERHYCFFEQAGGHAFANSDWISNNENNSPTSEQALQNNRTTWQLHQHLLSIGKNGFLGLEEEYQVLLYSTDIPPEEWGLPIMDVQKENQLNLGTPQKGVLAYVNGATGTYYARFEIWWQYITFWSIPITAGEHTSTWTKMRNSSNVLTRQYVTCNHGACADWSGMHIFCDRDFYNRADQIPFNTKCNVPATTGTMHPSGYTGCCNTRYNANPLFNNGHVCNDDSNLQLRMMVYNTTVVFGPFCDDTSLARYAPSCL